MNSELCLDETEPYRNLLAAILMQAINDARMYLDDDNTDALLTQNDIRDAIEFITTDRSKIYCEYLDIDHDRFITDFMALQFSRCNDARLTAHQRDMENRKRYNFRKNYERHTPTAGY